MHPHHFLVNDENFYKDAALNRQAAIDSLILSSKLDLSKLTFSNGFDFQSIESKLKARHMKPSFTFNLMEFLPVLDVKDVRYQIAEAGSIDWTV
jgi:hypothetical protein